MANVLLQIEVIKKWNKNQGVKGRGVLVQTRRILLTEGDQENMIDLRHQEEADTGDRVPGTEDRAPVPGIEGGKTLAVRSKTGNSKLRLSLKLLPRIQLILAVMFQQFIISTR